MINKINVDGVDHEIISESAEKKIAENKKKLDTLVVNNLTTGGTDKALSAEMGRLLEEKRVILYKMLGEKITMLCKVFGSNVLYDIMATFDVTSTTEPTRIVGEFAIDSFTKTYVDGVEVPDATIPTSTYTFSTISEHIV